MLCLRSSVIVAKVPRRDLLLKHMIQLLKSPAIGLWHTEVNPDAGNYPESTEDKACLAAEVTFIGVDHV